jgi:S-adenosylmethionine:tRNA ribosyltransferase-isomerase
MTELEKLLAEYDYPLEKDWIAEKPAEPRDSSKLLAYNRTDGSPRFDTFLNLVDHLPAGALLIINDTKVIPARLYGHIKTGGKVEIFVTNALADGSIEALINRRMEPGDSIAIAEDIAAIVVSKHESIYRLALKTDKSLEAVLQEHGTTPIPPYLKHTPLTEEELRERYQAIFAKNPGSVAAPTASLHFTDRLLEKLRQKGVEMAHVTLHVNLGTFAPLTANALATGQLHTERYSIPKETSEAIARAKAHNGVADGRVSGR